MVVLAEGERLAYLSPTAIPQGRYLFDVVAPIGIVYAQGARALLPRRVLGTWRPSLLAALVLLTLDVVAYLRYFAPAYLGRSFG
jgi:hypothetical protein